MFTTEDMQQDAINVASLALDKYPNEKDIASYIKKEFDKKYEPTWHCAVGRNFASFVTHEAKTMVLLDLFFLLLSTD
jgi:dynein light chain LC8-type